MKKRIKPKFAVRFENDAAEGGPLVCAFTVLERKSRRQKERERREERQVEEEQRRGVEGTATRRAQAKQREAATARAKEQEAKRALARKILRAQEVRHGEGGFGVFVLEFGCLGDIVCPKRTSCRICIPQHTHTHTHARTANILDRFAFPPFPCFCV